MKTLIAVRRFLNIELIFIVGLALLLRIAFLSNFSLAVDEASNAYDAYSFSETLRDQHGKFLPAFVEGIGGDARESSYILFSAFFIKIFGLNEFSVRLPSAIIGTITIFIVYELIKEFFDKDTATIGALLLAISPWHIHFSRVAFRAILMPLLFSIGLLFFLKSFKRKPYLIVSSLFFALSLWTYSAARVFINLFLLCLVLLFWQYVLENKKITIVSLCTFLVIFIPLLLFWISPEGMARAKAVGIENNLIQLIKNYFSYFNLRFLFIRGDTFLRHGPWKIGQLQYLEVVTLPIGIYYLLSNRTKKNFILLIWLVLYPIPAALTASQHSLRAIIGSILFPIISAYGITQIIKVFKLNKKLSYWLLVVLASASIACFGKFYFVDYFKYGAKAWSNDIVAAIKYADKSKYNCILINHQKYNPSYILVLFYTKYSPKKYHSWLKTNSLDASNWQIERYKVINVSNLQKIDRPCLFIATPQEAKLLNNTYYNISVLKDNIDYKIIELTPK